MRNRNNLPQGTGRIVIGAGVVILVAIVILRIIVTSVLLSARERVTVGVYTPHPFVLSYNKHSSIVTIVWFNPQTKVYIPGGYRWYPFGSVYLLDSIEKKQSELVRRTFEELVGAPVDFVVIPRKPEPLSKPPGDGFITFFYRERARLLPMIGGSYRVSLGNSVDRYLLSGVLRARNDKLLFVDARSATTPSTKKGDGTYYDSNKLDQVLKGYLYWPSIDHTNNVRIDVGDKAYYQAAQRIGRIIEGMGVKVIDVSIASNGENQKECIVYFGRAKKTQGNALAQHFDCTGRVSDEERHKGTMTFFIGSELGTLYR